MDHGGRNIEFMGKQSAEMQDIVSMLTHTFMPIAVNSERSLARLQAIESARELEDDVCGK